MSETKFTQISDLDPDARVKKWEPLTKGASPSCHGHMAWCLEEEARRLNNMGDYARQGHVGDGLKYVFPVIRGVVESFSTLDRVATMDVKEALAVMFQHQVNLACESIAKSDLLRPGSYTTEELQAMPVLATLGGRLADYTLSYPRLN